jgi:hypothetical protein
MERARQNRSWDNTMYPVVLYQTLFEGLGSHLGFQSFLGFASFASLNYAACFSFFK